jgi:hypothetical protein
MARILDKQKRQYVNHAHNKLSPQQCFLLVVSRRPYLFKRLQHFRELLSSLAAIEEQESDIDDEIFEGRLEDVGARPTGQCIGDPEQVNLHRDLAHHYHLVQLTL